MSEHKVGDEVYTTLYGKGRVREVLGCGWYMIEADNGNLYHLEKGAFESPPKGM